MGLLLLGLLGGMACGDPPLSGTEARLSVAPERVDFGPIYLGHPAEHEVRLQSAGSGTVRADLSLEGDAAFSLDRTTLELGSGVLARLRVTFTPAAEGVHAATLVVESNAADHPRVEVALAGMALPVPDCDDGYACTDDAFDYDLERCVHRDRTGPCDDGNACTTDDRCHEGACVGEAVRCEDDVACTADACDPEVGCVFLPDHSACGDGEACTWDRCDPERGCTRTTHPDGTPCGPSEQCKTVQACIWGRCREVGIPNGIPCEDGDPCTGGDTCTDGECIGERTQGDPELVQWLPTYGSDSDVTPALPLVDGRILVADPGPVLTVLEIVDGAARRAGHRVLQDVDLLYGWAEGAPGRVLAVGYAQAKGAEEGQDLLLVLEVAPGGTVSEVSRTVLRSADLLDTVFNLKVTPQLAYLADSGSTAWVVDWTDPAAPEVTDAPYGWGAALDARRRRLLVHGWGGGPGSVLPLDGGEPTEAPWIPSAAALDVAGDVLLARADDRLVLYDLAAERVFAEILSGHSEGRVWSDAALVGAQALVAVQTQGEASERLLQWWDLADPETPRLAAERPWEGRYAPPASEAGILGSVRAAWRVEEGAFESIALQGRGEVRDLVPYRDGLLSLSHSQARTYAFEEGLPREGAVLETGAGNLVLLPPGTPTQVHVMASGTSPRSQSCSDLTRLDEPAQHPLGEGLRGHLLAGRLRLYRVSTEWIGGQPEVQTLRLEAFDPDALYVDSDALVASPEWVWEQEIPYGHSLAAALDASETRITFVVSRREGVPHVQVHDVATGVLLAGADPCVPESSEGEVVAAASAPDSAVPDPAAGPLPPLAPMGCAPFDGSLWESWGVPWVAFEDGRLLIVQATYSHRDMWKGWKVQGLRAYDLEAGELLEVGSWTLPTVADLLHFDGRRAWLALGAQPGPLGWPSQLVGHGRILVLDTSDPAAAPAVVDLPQTPTSLVFRDGRMHLGSVTGLSTVYPACPAP